MLRATKWLTGLSRSSTNNSETTDSTVTPHSLDQLKVLYRLLEKNQKVSENNRTLLVETLRQIAEILIWGDQNDSSVFDFFLEKNMLYFFLNIMKQKCGGYVCTQLLQTLNILFENIKNETSLYYLLSNNHVNSIIIHKFDFSDEEVMAYYISFLKTLSLKLNGHTIHFFFNEHTADFPLYTEAIKFFNHPEKMVRIAVRTLTLNVFRVQEVAMLRFIRECTAAPYFSNLSWFIGKHIVDLNTSLMNYLASRHNQTSQSTNSNLINRLEDLVAEHLDHLHYLNDILLLNIDDLNIVLSDNLLYRLIIPLYVLSFLNIDDRFKNKQIKTVLSPTVAIFLLTQSFLILSYGTLLNTLILSLISTQNDIETISRKCEFTQPVQSLEVAIEQAIMTTSNQNSSASNEAGSSGSAALVEKKCSLAKHVQNDEIKQDQTLTNNNPSLDWRDKSFLVTLLAALNAEICPKTADDTHGHVRERSESKATINKQQDGAKKEKNQLYLTCHSDNTLKLIPDWTSSDDRIILFTLSLISAIISNEAIEKQTHENFFSPGNIAPKECPESYFNTLINSLLLIMRQCSLPNSSIRLVTFELAVHLFRKLILISGNDDENKNNNLNENLLSDHQIAVLEQAREDSSHVLRQYYCSIDKSVFLNLFEREARIFFNNSANKQATNHPASSPSSSSSSTSATSKSNIWSYNSSMTLEQHFMDAKLLLPPPEINLDDCNFHLRLPGMDYEKARYIIQVFFVLRLLSFDIRKIMGDDQIQEKIDDFSILLDDPSTSKLISMDHFIDLENCDLNSCSVAFYHPINQLRRSSTRRDRFSNSTQSTSAESSLSMLASGKKMPQFMAIVSELLILIEPDDKRYGWGIIRFIARLQDIEKIVIHAKDIGHVCTPPLPDKDDNRSLYIYFNNYNLSTLLIENKNNTRLKRPHISESIVARFQFNDTVRSLVARNNLCKAHKKVLDRKILSVANLIDITNHVNEVRTSSGASSTTRSGKSDNNKKSNNNQQHQVMGRTFAVPGGAVPSKYQSEPTNVNMANKVNVDINNINNKKRYAYPPAGYVVSSNRTKQPTSANMKASIENERRRKRKIKLPSSNPGDHSQEEFGIPLNDLSPNTIRKNGCNNNIDNDIGTTTTTTTTANTFIQTNHADDDCEFSKEGENVDGKNNNNNQSTNNTNNNSDIPNEIINNEKNKGKSTNLVAKSTASLVTGITKTKNTAGLNRSETFDV